MRKTQMQKPKPKPADTLLKTTKKKDIELTEPELKKATGGIIVRKVGDKGQQEF